MKNYIIYLSAIILIMQSCSLNRGITTSGKTVPFKAVEGGYNFGGNLPTDLPDNILKSSRELVETYTKTQSIVVDDVVERAEEAIMQYSLDPLIYSSNLWIRYGIYPKFDVGYSYSGSHKFDAQFQFMGSTRDYRNPSIKKFNGSIGVQYSSDSYALPPYFGLDDIQAILDYRFTRKDIQIPLLFSYSFGKEEEFGRIAWGAVYSHSFIRYSLSPENFFTEEGVEIEGISKKTNFPSFGLFANIKGGYKNIFATASITTYYQNYGSYSGIVSNKTYQFKGFTIIPSVGICLHLEKRH